METHGLQFLLTFYTDLATIDITDRDRIYKELVVIRVVVEGGKDER